MKKYEYILFDLDGTLLDSSEGVWGSIRYTLERFGLPEPTQDELYAWLGPPVKLSLRNFYSLSEPELEEAVAVFRQRYNSTDLYNAQVYPGMPALLGDLKKVGRKVGVATYKKIDSALDVLRHFELLPYFDEVRGADNEGRFSKHDIINQCLAALGAKDPRAAVMIGDTKYDAEGARRAGVDFIRASYGYGFRSPEDLHGLESVGQAEDVPGLAGMLLNG